MTGGGGLVAAAPGTIGVETLSKISIVWVGRTNVTDDRRQTDRRWHIANMNLSSRSLTIAESETMYPLSRNSLPTSCRCIRPWRIFEWSFACLLDAQGTSLTDADAWWHPYGARPNNSNDSAALMVNRSRRCCIYRQIIASCDACLLSRRCHSRNSSIYSRYCNKLESILLCYCAICPPSHYARDNWSDRAHTHKQILSLQALDRHSTAMFSWTRRCGLDGWTIDMLPPLQLKITAVHMMHCPCIESTFDYLHVNSEVIVGVGLLSSCHFQQPLISTFKHLVASRELLSCDRISTKRAQLLLRWPRNVTQVDFLLFIWWNLSLMHCFSVMSENRPIAINRIHCRKADSLGYLILVLSFADISMGLINHFEIVDPIPEAADLGEITQNNGQNKVTDFGSNKKSDVRLPIREKQCYILSRRLSTVSRSIGQIFAVNKGASL